MNNDKIKVTVATSRASTLGLKLARHIEKNECFITQTVSEECSSSVLRYGPI